MVEVVSTTHPPGEADRFNGPGRGHAPAVRSRRTGLAAPGYARGAAESIERPAAVVGSKDRIDMAMTVLALWLAATWGIIPER